MSDLIESPEACATPLVDLLRHVPADARLVVDSDDGLATQYIPIGRLAAEAISELTRLRSLVEADAEVERVLALSDDEVIAEAVAAGDDPEQVAAEMRAVLNAALASPPHGGRILEGWRDIESAPKDGFIVLYAPCVGLESGPVTAWAKWQGSGWYGVDEQGLTYMPSDHIGNMPTHWRPLPPPPATEQVKP